MNGHTNEAASQPVEREAGWTYEYDSGAGWDTHVVLNTPPSLATKKAPTKHYGSADIRNVRPFYYAASQPRCEQGAVVRLQEALDEASALIQYAKGLADGPDGGSVTDHLDFAESWLDKVRLYACAALSAPVASEPAIPAGTTLFREIDALGGTGMPSEGESWGRGYSEALSDALAILEKRGFTETSDAASPAYTPRPAATDQAAEVEKLAQFLHDEGGFDNAMTDRTWPEHPDDTGQREGGWVMIVPSDVQAHFRDVARRWLLPPATLTQQGAGTRPEAGEGERG